MAGSSFGFLLDTEEGSKSLNIAADFGMFYKFIKQIFIEPIYSLGLNNLTETNDFNASLKLSELFIGLGHQFQ